MEEHDLEAKHVIDAKKETIAADEGIDLALGASKIVAAKGKKIVEFKLRGGKLTGDADVADLRKAIIGPSGNLRAPTLFVGKTIYVGFSDELYSSLI